MMIVCFRLRTFWVFVSQVRRIVRNIFSREREIKYEYLSYLISVESLPVSRIEISFACSEPISSLFHVKRANCERLKSASIRVIALQLYIDLTAKFSRNLHIYIYIGITYSSKIIVVSRHNFFLYCYNSTI